MKCPTTDKLSQFVDELLVGQELINIKNHSEKCKECQMIVEAFKHEQQFLKETLSTPTLPDHFANMVLDKLEDYQPMKKRKSGPWKPILLSAAGIVLAVSLSATLNPAFAQWIGGLFSTNQVDEGLRIASESGFAKRVNQEVTDNGLTFKIEDVVADSSRVTFSYQLLNQNGKIKNPNFELFNTDNQVEVTNSTGKKLDIKNMSWGHQGDYGIIELSLRDQPEQDELTISFHLVDLNGKKGNWELVIPVDLRESNKVTTTLPLNQTYTSPSGVSIMMKEVKFAPSSNEIFYETAFTKEEQAKVIEKEQKLIEKFGEENVKAFTGYGSNLQYHIENEEGKVLFHHNTFIQGKGHPIDSGGLQGTGKPLGQMGHIEWNDSFIPQKRNHKLFFVLDGVMKTEPTDFSITIKPKELKTKPVSFEYEGNFITIKDAEKHSKLSLKKSLIPIERETIFKIEMEGGKQIPASDLGAWVLTDNKGKTYATFHSGSILDEKDKDGRYKTTHTLMSYDIDEVPDELTLHLLSVTRYYEINDRWKIPLHE